MTIVVMPIVVCRQLVPVNDFSLINCVIVLLIPFINHTFSYIMWVFFTYGIPFCFCITQIIWAVLCLVWYDFLVDFIVVFCLNVSSFLFPVFSMLASVFCMNLWHVECKPEVCISQINISNGFLHHFKFFIQFFNWSTKCSIRHQTWPTRIFLEPPHKSGLHASLRVL